MSRYFARKTPCRHGHTHDSRAEAKRCEELHLLLRAGEIEGLAYAPQYWFEPDGRPLKLANGRRAGFKADFSYIENGKVIVEDVKASNGFVARDVPLRWALFRHCYPEITLRIVK